MQKRKLTDYYKGPKTGIPGLRLFFLPFLFPFKVVRWWFREIWIAMKMMWKREKPDPNDPEAHSFLLFNTVAAAVTLAFYFKIPDAVLKWLSEFRFWF